MAGDRQVGVDVRAKVSGAKDVEKLAKDVDKLTDKPATLEVDAKVNPAIDRVLDKLGKIDEDAKAAAVAAEALGRALGPELSDRADMTAVVAELKRLGASFDEITANADEFGAKLKSIDSDDLGGRMGRALGTARGETEKLSAAADKSRNAMANMWGNVAQDAGALGGITGSLGVGFGQLAEGAADAANGGQKLSSALGDVAKVAGPMAALGVAMQLLNAAMDAAAASRAFDDANIDQYTAALRDGTTAVSSFNDEIRETGELAYRAKTGGGPLGMFSSTRDLLPVLEANNIKIAQFNDLVAEYVKAGDGSAEMNDRWRASLEAAGVSQNDAIKIVQAANQESDARTEALTREARVTDLLGDSEAELARQARLAADAETLKGEATELSAWATEQAAAVQADAAAKYDEATQAMLDQVDALTAQVDAATAAADTQLAQNDAYAKFGELLGDAEASTDDLADAAIGLAKATQTNADATAKAAGTTRTATGRVDTFNDSLLATAGTLNGEARTAVANYIADVNRVPPEKRTEFIALVQAGKLDEAKNLLNGASATRTAAIQADATNVEATRRELDDLARDRTAIVRVQTVATGGVYRPPGTPVPTMAPPPEGAGPAQYGAVAASTGDSYGAPAVSTHTLVVPAPTINVTLQSAVIGSPTAVARAVRKATRDGVRLAGSR